MSPPRHWQPAFEPSPQRLAAARRQRRRGRRLGWLLGDTIFDRIRVDYGLRFLHEALGLEQLSYGLWEEQDPLTLDGLQTAQARYAELLRSWIPAGVHRILDVGCGTGATTLLLGEQGYELEGLSPDPYQQKIYQQRTGRPFHLVRFELFFTERPFDLVLMSESCQYVMLDQLFRCIMHHSPGAYLLVADYFRIADGSGPAAKSGHALDQLLDEARLWGFDLVREQDITEQVAPTLELARRCVDQHLLPGLRVIRDSIADRHRLLARIGGWLLRRPIRSWTAQAQLIDRDEFLRSKRYLVLLLKGPASMDELAQRHRQGLASCSAAGTQPGA